MQIINTKKGAVTWKVVLISFVLFILIVGFLVFKIGLLSKISTTFLSKLGGAKVSVNSPQTITYNDENAQFSTSNNFPDGFPKDFPIPPGSIVTTSWKSGEDKNVGYSVVLENKDSSEALASFFKSNLASNGWTLTNQTGGIGNSAFSFEKGSFSGFVGVSGKGDKTVISITIGERINK